MIETLSCVPEPSVSVKVLVNVPYAVGVNPTLMMHVAPAARTEGHVFLSAIDGSPFKATFKIATDAPLVFVTVSF